jgi:hypothetical protein
LRIRSCAIKILQRARTQNRVPLLLVALLAAWLSPPEGFFRLARDIAPGKSDVVQVAVGPLRQFTPRTLALAPDMKRLAKLGEKARMMIICHRFMGTGGHIGLQNLIFDL